MSSTLAWLTTEPRSAWSRLLTHRQRPSTASGRVTATALLLGLALLLGAWAPNAQAAETVALPFAAGTSVRIIQGYNGGTHQGRSRYALDLMVARGETSGVAVLAPVGGRVAWAQAPNARNGCIALAFAQDRFSVVLCHVLLDRAFARGQSVARGQRLGTVGRPGTVGNNGTPHVHLELHRGATGNNPIPFGGPDGLPLEGIALASDGSHNQYAGRAPISSTNGAAETPGAQIAPAPPATRDRAPATPGTPTPAPRRSSPQANAVVAGTESCLNVREKPALGARLVKCLPDGANVAVVAAPARADGFSWRRLDGLGWAVAEYLRRTSMVVQGTESCLNVREQPATDARILKCLPDGASVVLAEGPIPASGLDWYRLTEGGWVVGEYLE